MKAQKIVLTTATCTLVFFTPVSAYALTPTPTTTANPPKLELKTIFVDNFKNILTHNFKNRFAHLEATEQHLRQRVAKKQSEGKNTTLLDPDLHQIDLTQEKFGSDLASFSALPSTQKISQIRDAAQKVRSDLDAIKQAQISAVKILLRL